METAILPREDEEAIERAFLNGCRDLEISIFDIPKIFNEGRRLLRRHCDEMELRVLLRFFVVEHCDWKSE